MNTRNKNRILIFTEAGTKIGLGHLTRCSALYDAGIKMRYNCKLIVYTSLYETSHLDGKDFELIDWKDKAYLNKNINSKDCCIIDSYLADYDIYDLITKLSKKCIYIDDTARIEYPQKGIIVNPSLYPYKLYNCSNGRKYALGAKYIILRKVFTENQQMKNRRHNIKNVLIVMGGTDIRNLTTKITDYFCDNYNNINFHVLNYAGSVKMQNLYTYTDLSDKEMQELMVKCDFAITGAGQTIYELITTKTPFIPIQMAKNQTNNVLGLIKYKILKNVINYDDDLLLNKLEKNFLFYVDNYKNNLFKKDNIINTLGSKSIIKLFSKTDIDTNEIMLRQVKIDDCYDAFLLSNQEYVRKNAISKETIKWEDHLEWFDRMLSNPRFKFYVVSDKYESFLGQIKYEIKDTVAIISIHFCKSILGRGLSVELLKQSLDLFFSEFDEDVTAFVYNYNTPSLKLFSNAGFDLINQNKTMSEYVFINQKKYSVDRKKNNE